MSVMASAYTVRMRTTASKNIFLVGPMGVGKTTIGRMLAKEVSLEFMDSDQEIEKRAGADISWIFDVEGEEGFRNRETQMIDELTRLSGILLATGGGSILRPANRRWLQARGFVIFLDTSLELQMKRTQRDKKRPLLQKADRKSVLKQLRQERQALYEEVADIRVYVGESGSRRIVNGIMEQLREAGYLGD